MNGTVSNQSHLLLYEPRIEGHHLPYLRIMVEDLLSANFRLSIAADLRPGSRERVEQCLAGLSVHLLSAYDESGRRHLDGKSRSVAYCLEKSGANNVFLCEFDEIASHCWRSATFGFLPPAELRGRMGGLYYRPRFMYRSPLSPDRWLKEPGFRRMINGKWLRPLLLADEFVTRDLQAQFPSAPIFYLPDPCPTGYEGDYHLARKQLTIPTGKFVFLFLRRWLPPPKRIAFSCGSHAGFAAGQPGFFVVCWTTRSRRRNCRWPGEARPTEPCTTHQSLCFSRRRKVVFYCQRHRVIAVYQSFWKQWGSVTGGCRPQTRDCFRRTIDRASDAGT